LIKKIFFLLAVVFFLTATVFYSKNNPRPKNIILLIGDGMGLGQVSTSALFSKVDQFKKFYTIGLVNTCSADNLITDSAAGATAYATGYRTNNAVVSQDPQGNYLQTILEIAENKKMSTGLVVTSSITNATPACFYSHVKHRNMEFDIAEQFVHSGIDFVIGGGADFFVPLDFGGKREDHKNFLDTLSSYGYKVYQDFSEMNESSVTKKVTAILGHNGIAKASDRNYSLGDMTKKAISHLNKNKNGFFLMIEGSQIDWAGHNNDEEYLLQEMDDFNKAIEAALEFAKKDGNTLVVITADHETGGMSITSGNLKENKINLGWLTKKHTANLVGVFSYGIGAENFNGIQNNFIIGRKLINYIEPKKSWK